MKTISRFNMIASFVACAMWAGVADASLVGDTVTVGHYSPDSSTPLGGFSSEFTSVVEAGTGDNVLFYFGYPYAYNVNVEAASILVDYTYLAGASGTWCADAFCAFGTAVSFNGLGVSGLDDSSGNNLQNVLIDTNMVGWEASRLSFGDHNVLFDWKGLSFDNSTYFNATLQYSAVPLPPAVFLFGSGLIGLLGLGRKNKQG
jgi:hypothetical protein